VYRNQLSRQIGSRNLTGPKTLPTIWYTYMMLVTKYQIPVINSCWEKCPSVRPSVRPRYFSCWWQKSDIWSQASYRYTILWVAFLDPSDSYFLFADLVDFYTHWTYMHIFRHIFLSNYWWQRSDIWSQASYRYPISWEAFLTGSSNLTGQKTLPTIWGTYMKLVTKYQISATNSCWEKWGEKWAYMCICAFFVAFFSATIDGRNLIFGHKLHIGTPYRGKRFWTRQIPTSCLPTLSDGSKNASHDMGYLYETCDQISDFCHQQLLRKMWLKMGIYKM
jgi:hypothetical protein